MADPLEDIAYLTRSENRVEVLALLAEGPRDRTALKEATDVSRVTMGRMLGELEDRGWISRDGHDYCVTHVGRIVAEDLSRLLRTTNTAQKLREVEAFLPVEAFDFDLRRLDDAEVFRPTRSDPNAPMRRMSALLSASDRVRVFAPAVAPLAVRAHRERVLDAEDHRASVVFTPDAVDVALSDPDMRTWFREMVETGRYEWFRYDGTFPANVVIADGTVLLTLYDDTSESGFHSMVESDDDRVRSWAVSTFERYRSESERVDREVFADAS
jgi:predicted transcriptional regulator